MTVVDAALETLAAQRGALGAVPEACKRPYLT